MENVEAFGQMLSIGRFFLWHKGAYANILNFKNQIANMESKKDIQDIEIFSGTKNKDLGVVNSEKFIVNSTKKWRY